MIESRIDADRLCIRFGADQTGMTVASIATNAEALPRVLLVDPDPQRHVKRLQSRPLEIVVQMLKALFVTDCRILVRRAGPGLRRIFTTIAVYVVKMLGFRVIRFQLVVADGPGRRDATVMTNLTEVFFSQTEESRAVELRVTTDEVIRVRV